MADFYINVLKDVNGLKFGSKPSEVHKVLGANFKKNSSELSDSSKDFLLEVSKKMAEMSGRPLEDFTKYDNYDEFDSDTSDYYPECKIEYDDNDFFEAIEIYSDKHSRLIIKGKDYSDFNLKSLLTLADDFVSEEKNTLFRSYSSQISIWCPDGDGRVECILFGTSGYFQKYLG